MTRADKLIDFIRRELLAHPEDQTVTADVELLTTGMVNSLGLMRLISFIREELGTEVPYGDILIENFRSVRSIDAYLAKREAGAVH